MERESPELDEGDQPRFSEKMTMLAWLRSLAKAFLGRTGKPDRVDPAPEPAPDVDPLAELAQIINEDPKPEPRPPKAPTFSRRRRSGRAGA